MRSSAGSVLLRSYVVKRWFATRRCSLRMQPARTLVRFLFFFFENGHFRETRWLYFPQTCEKAIEDRTGARSFIPARLDARNDSFLSRGRYPRLYPFADPNNEPTVNGCVLFPFTLPMSSRSLVSREKREATHRRQTSRATSASHRFSLYALSDLLRSRVRRSRVML